MLQDPRNYFKEEFSIRSEGMHSKQETKESDCERGRERKGQRMRKGEREREMIAKTATFAHKLELCRVWCTNVKRDSWSKGNIWWNGLWGEVGGCMISLLSRKRKKE